MADLEHIAELRKGARSWNKWRGERPALRPDFAGAGLPELDLYFGAELSHADFSGVDLTSANLEGANLSHANLRHANLSGASLRKTRLYYADLGCAYLSGASLLRAYADHTSFRKANLSGANLDISTCVEADFHGALIKDVSFCDMTPVALHYFGGSVVNLVDAQGLDMLHPESVDFLREFIPGVFRFVHYMNMRPVMVVTEVDSLDNGHVPIPIGDPTVHRLEPIPYDRKAVDEMLLRLQLFEQIYTRDESANLVAAIRTVNSELIQYLKRHPTDLRRLNWRTFEELIAELLRNFGWFVELTEPTKDNGYDIFGIHRDVSGISHTWIIECKCWAESRKVGVEIARSLYTVKNELKVGGALLATTSDFTRGVEAFKASRYDFELKNYEGILAWLDAYRK